MILSKLNIIRIPVKKILLYYITMSVLFPKYFLDSEPSPNYEE